MEDLILLKVIRFDPSPYLQFFKDISFAKTIKIFSGWLNGSL